MRDSGSWALLLQISAGAEQEARLLGSALSPVRGLGAVTVPSPLPPPPPCAPRDARTASSAASCAQGAAWLEKGPPGASGFGSDAHQPAEDPPWQAQSQGRGEDLHLHFPGAHPFSLITGV